jgi:branched-chain amino acid transport system substrate-binding protein
MQTRKHVRPALFVGVLTFLFASGTFIGCGKNDGGGGDKGAVIKIGEYGSLTGSEATFGHSTKNGVDLAIKEINDAGGIGGAKLEVVVEDDQSQAQEAATVVDKLLSQDNVAAVIGEVASSRSLAGGPKCQLAGVPMISPSSTNPEVTKKGDFIFRVCFIDPFQGTVMAKFVTQNLHAKTAAILRDVKSDYSAGLAKYFTDTFTQLGGRVVAEEAYSSGDTDFKPQLTSVKGKKPDVVFIPGYYTEAGLIARQAREVGITVPLVGGDGWDSQDLVKVGKDKLLNSFFSTHYSAEDTSAAIQNFVKKYNDAYHEVPDAIGALAYDATKILAAAMQRVAEKDPKMLTALTTAGKGEERKAADKMLRDEIAATRDFVGVTGRITLDQDRNAVKPAVVVEITQASLQKPGTYKYVTTIQP